MPDETSASITSITISDNMNSPTTLPPELYEKWKCVLTGSSEQEPFRTYLVEMLENQERAYLENKALLEKRNKDIHNNHDDTIYTTVSDTDSSDPTGDGPKAQGYVVK